MISEEFKQLKSRLKRFEKEVLFHEEYEDFGFQSIFLDTTKDGKRRAVVILDRDTLSKSSEVVARYFEGYPFKIIIRQGLAEGTAAVNTGTGVSNKNGWGTMGGLFKRKNDRYFYGLSNNHVIANLNNCNVNDLIKGKGGLKVGKLFRWVIIKDPPSVNGIDAAIFRIDPSHSVSWKPRVPSNVVVGPRINLNVYKNGLTTGITTGYIKAYNGSAKVRLGGRLFRFRGIMAIKGKDSTFNMPGDSGSVVLTSKGHHPVGIVFAKYKQYCYALPISKALPLLK